MKIKRIRVLPILAVGGVIASLYGVINHINSEKSSFAAERNANIASTIENLPDEIVGGTARGVSLKLNINTTERANNGDTVKFCTHGLGSINQSDVSLPNGEVIGKVFSLAAGENNRIVKQRDLANNTAARLELDQGGADYCHAIQFNANAEKYSTISDIDISFQKTIHFVAANTDYTTRVKVTDSQGGEIFGKDVLVKSINYKTGVTDDIRVIGSYRLDNEGGAITGKFLPSVQLSSGKSLPVGSTLKFPLTGSGFEYINNYSEGDIVEFTRDIFFPYDGIDTVNGNNVYVYQDLGKKRFKVIRHTSDELVLESLDVVEGGISYGMNQSSNNVMLVDQSKLVAGSNSITEFRVKASIIDGNTSSEFFPGLVYRHNLVYSGQNVAAGNAVIARGTVIAKYVDQNDREISTQKIVANNQPFGTRYSDTEIHIPGYVFDSLKAGSALKQGAVNDSTQTITYVYTQQRGSVIVKHLDAETGREIHQQETIVNNQPYGTQFTAQPKTIANYDAGVSTDTTTGTVNAPSTTITFRYTSKKGSVVVKHIDAETGREISQQETIQSNKPYGTQYSAQPKTITNYGSGQLTFGTATGTINTPNTVITFSYSIKRGTVIVKHLDAETGREVSPQETIQNNQPYGTQFTARPKTIANYNEGTSTDTTTGTINAPSTTITFRYAPKKGSVYVEHVDAETGREISPRETLVNNQNYGTQYNAQPKAIANYEAGRLVSGVATGSVSAPTTTIRYQYSIKRGSVVVKYVDENGKELATQKSLHANQPYGTNYTSTNTVKIVGYRQNGLATGSAPETGRIDSPNKTISYKFEKIPVTANQQTIKIGQTPDPKDHLPEELKEEFKTCEIRYKESPKTDDAGIINITIVISCQGQDDREVNTKIYTLGGKDVFVKNGEKPDPKSHIPDFDKKFPGCEIKYSKDIDTSTAGVFDIKVVISCPGEDDKEIDTRIVVIQNQSIKVGETPDPKKHIPDFDKKFPGCTVKYKNQPDTSKAGKIDAEIVISCPDKEDQIIKVQFEVSENPQQSQQSQSSKIDAPHTGAENNAQIPVLISISAAILSLLGITFGKNRKF